MLLYGFVQPVHKRKGAAETSVGLGGILVKANGLPVLGDGFLHLPLVIKGGAKADVGLGVVVPYVDRQKILTDGLIEFTLPTKGFSETGVRGGVHVLEINGLSK